ncbi:OmpA family protein [Leadbetterella sp. DM7]|uniref:OmpA family protein n=1 Tax=Leadbetterella sp. DM7 TaxID=3235085 RepID=UPI00349EF076
MRSVLTLLLLIFCFFSGPAGVAQLKSYKRGLSSFENGHYNIAIQEFLKVKDIEQAYAGDLNRKLGDAYRLSNRWAESIPYYEKAIENGVKDSDLLFYLGYALKSKGEYTRAKDYFKRFADSNPADKVLAERVLREMNSLLLTESIFRKNSEKEFRNLEAVNTPGSEFTGVVHKGYLVFAASRKEKIYANDLPYLGLYKARISENLSTVGKTELFSASVFADDRNEGSPTFTPDGKIMVFARGNSGKRKDLSPDVDLYMSRYVEGDGWTSPVRVPASDSLAFDGSPAFSGDGKTLYFSSNRAGGNGGLDIYRVNMDASGRFGNAVNMGKAINTAGDEAFPFVSADGKLYFASDGHPGLGKLDLFVAIRTGGKITVENLGLPYNSSMDDFGYTEDEYGNEFFTSNRSGGKGDDDIYYYLAPETPVEVAETPVPEQDKKVVNYFLAGEVLSEGKLLDSAVVNIYKIEGGIETLFAENLVTRNGQFGPVKMEEDEDYVLLTEKPGYLTKREGFTMYGRSIPSVLLTRPVTDTTFHVRIPLDGIFVGKTFRLENIYYDLDKADIRPDAALELDKLVQILKDNPGIRIELGSHTDSRASDIYNLRLSQRRADAAINYIVNKGISRERLEARGYGESELLIENAKTEAEHQQNRRTEFKVTGIGKAEE